MIAIRCNSLWLILYSQFCQWIWTIDQFCCSQWEQNCSLLFVSIQDSYDDWEYCTVVWFFAIFWPRQSCPVIQQLHQSESGPRYLLVVLVFWLSHLFVVLCLDKAGNQLSFCLWIYASLEPISSITTHLASNRALATCLNEVNKRKPSLSTASRRMRNHQTFSKPWPWTLKLTL
jgi:hypothetical protein